MKLPKMIYLMHVHWNWIKQRPHFLFEEMTKYYSIDLFYINRMFYNNKINNQRKSYNEYTVSVLYKLPYSGRSTIIELIEKKINLGKLNNSSEYEYVWITSPIIMKFLPDGFLENKKVIYDCMDNFLAFDVINKDYDKNKMYEKELIAYSNIVFVSSEHLKTEMIKTYREDLRNDPIVINNGISSAFINRDLSFDQSKNSSTIFNMMYIGTIAEWLDIHLLIKILTRYSYIQITLIGPIDVVIPSHPRLIVIGPIEHHLLPDYAIKADVFIMPFILNELILSVNPVKIYEYLSFYKPVISVKYDEIEKFKPFVKMYSTEEELFEIIDKIDDQLMEEEKKEEINNFLERNTWGKRSEVIRTLLIN